MDRNERKQKLRAELKEIEDQERRERDVEKYHQLIGILDAGDTILPFIRHTRTSCSDENPVNGYTTSGRGGNVRCTKCAFMDAVESWKDNREWLLPLESGEEIEKQIGFNNISIEVNIMTESED